MPEGNGENRGVGALEGGTGSPSGAMEYTTMRANDATFPQSDCVLSKRRIPSLRILQAGLGSLPNSNPT